MYPERKTLSRQQKMASDIYDHLDDDDFDEEIDRRIPNLYSTAEERNKALNKKYLIHRYVTISKLRNYARNAEEIGNYYKRLFKELQNTYQSEPITGLLLVYHNYIVHVIETSTDTLLKITQDLLNVENDDAGFATKSKILVVSHDIPERLYGQWIFRALDIEAHNLDQIQPSDDTYKLVGDVLVQLIKLGVYLHRKPMLNMKESLNTLYQQVPEFLPQQAVIHFLLSEDDSSIMTPKEYLDIYSQTFDFNLDSDFTWPMGTRTFPYK